MDDWRSSETGEALSDRIEEAKIAAGEEAERAAQAVEDGQPEREAVDINAPGIRAPLPVPEPRGDEHLCARCEQNEGAILDDEGRLICAVCDDEDEPK